MNFHLQLSTWVAKPSCGVIQPSLCHSQMIYIEIAVIKFERNAIRFYVYWGEWKEREKREKNNEVKFSSSQRFEFKMSLLTTFTSYYPTIIFFLPSHFNAFNCTENK